jgi:hypothetical protein
MSENPAHPDAPPTAPGGMSRAALVEELVTEWGWERESDWDSTPWPQLIQWVIDERSENEADQPDEDAEVLAEWESEGYAEDSEPVEDEATGIFEWETADYTHEDPNPGVSRSQMNMFADEGPDPMVDEEATAALVEMIDADFEAAVARPLDHDVFEDFTVDPEVEMGKAMADDDVMDPEALFEEMFAARAEIEAAAPPPIFIGIPGVRDYIFDGHAGAGPSGAERWMNCTMSLSASRKFLETLSPNQAREFARAGTAARQGTTAHAAGEAQANHMLGRIDDDELEMTLLELTVDPEHETEAYDEEMGDYVGEYVDLVRSYAQERGADSIDVERRVEAAIPLVGVHEGEVYIIRGSADLTVVPVKKHRSLVVGDLKYGEGIDVDVDENPQIRLYALGVLGEHVDEEGNLPAFFDEVEYIIAQPRLGGIKRWTESVDDLLTWRDEVLAPALTKALYGAPEGATYEPSDLACQWCPARGSCPALAEKVMTEGAGLFEAMSEAEFEGGPGAILETTSLSPARLSELLKMSEDVDKLRTSLKAEAQRRLHRGEGVPGYHLVNYSPPRHWVEDAQDKIAQGELPLTSKQRDLLFTEPKLLSPPQAEKALGKEGFPAVLPLVVKPDPVPVIARENDRRKAWEGKPPEAMFADEGGDADE